MDFNVFKQAVSKRFQQLTTMGELFITETDKDTLWGTYLNSFPEGTNPMFRKRTEYDCSCCRQFVKAIGNVVVIDSDHQLHSIWDLQIPDVPAFQTVANALAAYVKSCKIVSPFLTQFAAAGTDRTFEQIMGEIQTWNHFHVTLPKTYVKPAATIGTTLGAQKTQAQVFDRSLRELTPQAIETVLELIAQGSLYRGEEHLKQVRAFQALQKDYLELTTELQKTLFVWKHSRSNPGAVTGMRSTVIGTLIDDLSKGTELEDAVRMFESKVAPTNYKRPKSLVTPKMVEQAKAKLQELGLVTALERRHATLDDVEVTNMLYAGERLRRTQKDVFDVLGAQVEKTPNFDRVEEVSITKFFEDIVPKSKKLSVFFGGEQTSHLVSLIAPTDHTAGRLFKWDNPFSWSYNGEVADSMKERVKKAGGKIEGDLCCRLAWFNYDDLDFHLDCPDGTKIYFRNRNHHAGGELDVDANAGYGTTRTPVENIVFSSCKHMPEGQYTLSVHNFNRREADNVGFEVELDMLGDSYSFAHPTAIADRTVVEVAVFTYTKADGFKLVRSLPHSRVSKNVWGLATQQFHPVTAIMKSPNFWGENAVGNEHYFFMLEGCKCDTLARGFYNEFLAPQLDEHRKVLEVVGSKLLAAPTGQPEMSGLGFSTTQRASVLVKVEGTFNRIVRVKF